MRKRAAILQSSYLPWKGYFDIIHDVDDFIFLDDVQYTRQDWRNRNLIKTSRGGEWLTVPVGTNIRRRICDVRLPSGGWAAEHWSRIERAYRATPAFNEQSGWLAQVFGAMEWPTLSALNQHLIRTIAISVLKITATIRDSRDFELTRTDAPTERLIALLRCVGADVYVSGPAARAYLDERLFHDAGIAIEWKDYGGYPEYPQLHPPFLHQVSVIDLIFNTGADAPGYIWGWRTR